MIAHVPAVDTAATFEMAGFDCALVLTRPNWRPAHAADPPARFVVDRYFVRCVSRAQADRCARTLNEVAFRLKQYRVWAVVIRRPVGHRSIDRLMSEAEDLWTGGYYVAAGCIARSAIDTWVRMLHDAYTLRPTSRRSVAHFLRYLVDSGVIDDGVRRRCLDLLDIGNAAAHNNPISREAVRRLIDGAREVCRPMTGPAVAFQELRTGTND